jgi:hypothetical protein
MQWRKLSTETISLVFLLYLNFMKLFFKIPAAKNGEIFILFGFINLSFRQFDFVGYLKTFAVRIKI